MVKILRYWLRSLGHKAWVRLMANYSGRPFWKQRSHKSQFQKPSVMSIFFFTDFFFVLFILLLFSFWLSFRPSIFFCYMYAQTRTDGSPAACVVDMPGLAYYVIKDTILCISLLVKWCLYWVQHWLQWRYRLTLQRRQPVSWYPSFQY